MDDGSRDEWHSTLYWPEIKLYGDNAVECRSTLLRVGNSRVPVHYLKTASLHSLYALATVYRGLSRRV